jgi:uncharacterized protein with PIN domain
MKLKFHFRPTGGTKRIVDNPIWLNMKKHYCPECRGELHKVEVSKVVNSKSEEAQYFDFSAPGGGWFHGDVKFIWTELRCSRCGKQYTVKEIKKREAY